MSALWLKYLIILAYTVLIFTFGFFIGKIQTLHRTAIGEVKE